MTARKIGPYLGRRAPWLLVACAVLLASAAGADPIFVGLGFAEGWTQSTARAVSADGSVVVGTAGLEAARWTLDEGLVPLGRAAGGTGSAEAFAVSADGSVIVGRTKPSYNSFEAFRWTEEEGMVGLGSLSDGQVFSHGRAVSADGSVVVGDTRIPGGGVISEAFRWTADDGMIALGTLPGATQSYGFGVSADGGTVVGRNLFSEAFVWTQEDGMQGLGTLSGGSTSSADAVSADGSVVVGQSDSALGPQAFRWTEGGGLVGLGDLAGGKFASSALAVSADGSIVVGYAYLVEDSSVAMIWDAEHGMRSLMDVLVADYGLDLSGWTLHQATGISADGRTIVGVGTHNGRLEGWVFVPEPAPALLGLASLLLAGGRLRRRGRRARPGRR